MNFFNAYEALINNKIITRNNFEYCLKFFPAINSTVLFVRFIKEDGTVESFWSGLDFILVNKGYGNTKDEFEMNGDRYTYFEKSFGFLEGHASFVVKCK